LKKSRLILYTLFSILLVVNLLFFIVVRSDMPEIYRNVFDNAAALVTSLGAPISSHELEAIFVVIGFIVVSVSSAVLLFWAVREFIRGGSQTVIDSQARNGGD